MTALTKTNIAAWFFLSFLFTADVLSSQQVLLRDEAGESYLYSVDTKTVNEGASGLLEGATTNSDWTVPASYALR